MAHLEYPSINDPVAQAATDLAHAIGLLILNQTDSVNVALTGMTQALAATLTYVPESEVESTLVCISEAVRVGRARLLAPPVSEMN